MSYEERKSKQQVSDTDTDSALSGMDRGMSSSVWSDKLNTGDEDEASVLL